MKMSRGAPQGGKGRAGLSPALRWALDLAVLMLWCLAVGVVSLRLASAKYGPELFGSYFRYLILLALNLLPGFIVALFFLTACNRFWPAVLASGLLVTGLSLINYYKLAFRDDPLLASDASYFQEAAQISSRYNISVTPLMVLGFAAIIGASVLAFFFLRARFTRALPRIVTAAVLIVLSAGLYLGVYSSARVYDYTSNLKVAFSDGSALNEWNETDKYCCRGFLYPFIHSFSTLSDDRPAGYSAEKAAALLAEYESADIPADKKVSVVSVMLESFGDLSALDGFPALENDPCAFFHQLQEQSVSGNLVTNIFAGGTIDTERCYITGSTRMYDYRGDADSYARYFSAQGYYTEFCHPGYGWFYNRQNVMPALGFQSCHFFEDRYAEPESAGEVNIMDDADFFADLESLFAQRTASGTPYFQFSVTYQNHGPYDADRLDHAGEEYVARGGLSDESYYILNNYFAGIRRTDDALRQLVSYYEDSDSPVVLVLFGDHKPWLGDDSSVYAELGVDLSCQTDESFYNYYDTPYVVWANSAAKAVLGDDFCGAGGDFSPCFLMEKVFSLCGWSGDGYMAALRELYGGGVDVVNAGGRFRENGELTTALSAEGGTLLDRVLCLQYYRMRDWAREG